MEFFRLGSCSVPDFLKALNLRASVVTDFQFMVSEVGSTSQSFLE
jgi:hypothetical protein